MSAAELVGIVTTNSIVLISDTENIWRYIMNSYLRFKRREGTAYQIASYDNRDIV